MTCETYPRILILREHVIQQFPHPDHRLLVRLTDIGGVEFVVFAEVRGNGEGGIARVDDGCSGATVASMDANCFAEELLYYESYLSNED